MSTVMSNFKRSMHDHFEPEGATDPQAQRRLRGQLEQIDYTAFASNQAVLGQMLGAVDASRFQRMAVAAAQARGRWAARAVALADAGHELSAAETAELAALRTAYEELREAYEALRRMVERGYLVYGPAA
jgi:hypothetical protein